jgi:hypothetical protein
MHLLNRLYTPVAEIVAVVNAKMDARSTNVQTAKWTIIPPKHAGRECTLNTTQTMAIQTETKNEHAATSVS